MELKELQERVDGWIHQYGVRYFSELTNMAVLTEEVGELARIMPGQPDGGRPHGRHGGQLRQEDCA